MPRRVSDSTLEEIRSANDIVNVIHSYFQLQQRGSTFKALCPFHKEKTPSFIVNQQRQIFHCFGCGAGGDVFRFIMDYEKVDFPTAIRMLARRAGVRLSLEDADDGKSGKDALFEILEKSAALYHGILRKEKEAVRARRYLRSRGLDQAAVVEFMLGFAPAAWDTILRWAGNKYSLKQLEAAGLIIGSDRGSKRDTASLAPDGTDRHYYDRFRDRIMFPVHDELGRVVGFSARDVSGRDEGAKYINTPETAVFHKSSILYGLHRARREIAQAREAIVCEGQLDVIRCHMAGFNTAVAPQGTAFTEEHARVLKRYADSVLIVFDADEAGRNAALRAADLVLESGMAVRIADLPRDEDPDSLLQRDDGPSVFRDLLNGAQSALDFRIDILAGRDDLSAEAGLMRAVSAVIEMIGKSPDAVRRDMLLRRASERLGLSEDSLRREFQKKLPRARSAAGRSGEPVRREQTLPVKEKALAMHLVSDPSLARLVDAYLPLAFITNPLCRKIVQAAVKAFKTGEDVQRVVSGLDGDDRELSRFAAAALGAAGQTKMELATDEERVKALILGIRTAVLRRQRSELERAQIVSRNQDALSAARRKEIEMEYCQLGYDIAKLKSWETAVPVMEIVDP